MDAGYDTLGSDYMIGDRHYPLMSRSIAKISKALSEAEKELGFASKDSKNPFFNSKYADLSSVIEATRPVLVKHGIKILQPLLHSSETGVRVQTVLLHESGEFISDGGPLMPVDKINAQGYGSAITYARRYGLAALVGITQADDDGNEATQAAPKEAMATEAQMSYIKNEISKLPENIFSAFEKWRQGNNIPENTMTARQLSAAKNKIKSLEKVTN